MDSTRVTVLDIRYPTLPVAELQRHQVRRPCPAPHCPAQHLPPPPAAALPVEVLQLPPLQSAAAASMLAG